VALLARLAVVIVQLAINFLNCMKFKIIANWKMNPGSLSEAKALTSSVKDGVIPIVGYDLVLIPPSIYIPVIYNELKLTSIYLGVQNIHSKLTGRFTGEISASMIRDYCQYTLLGHSEIRAEYGETNEQVNQKVLTALDQKIKPIICLGETLEDYRKGQSDLAVEHMKSCLKNVSREDIVNTTICYEPIWAISNEKGTNPADADYANQIIMLLRQGLAAIYNRELAYRVPIIYGGSIDSNDVTNYQDQPEINGVLVGNASLDSAEFVKLCKNIANNK